MDIYLTWFQISVYRDHLRTMNYFFPGDFWMTNSMQNIGEWITPVMKLFTWLGYPQAYMILIAIIYWSFDRKLGLRMSIFLPVVSSFNSILKQAFHGPRPYWLDPNIKAIHVSNGFGMPSGHAQAATVWLYMSSLLKRRWFWVMAITITLMVGLSRVYLGVHFSSQVVTGWLIGIMMVILFIRYESWFLTWFLSRKLNIQLLFITGISFLFLLLAWVFVFVLREWEIPLEWIRNSADDLAGKDESIISSIGLAATAGNTGGFMGAAIGAVLSHRNGGFDPGGMWWKRLVRSVIGLLLFFALYTSINWIAPEETQVALYAIWRFGAFFVISFSAIFLIPVLFLRINLVSR